MGAGLRSNPGHHRVAVATAENSGRGLSARPARRLAGRTGLGPERRQVRPLRRPGVHGRLQPRGDSRLAGESRWRVAGSGVPLSRPQRDAAVRDRRQAQGRHDPRRLCAGRQPLPRRHRRAGRGRGWPATRVLGRPDFAGGAGHPADRTRLPRQLHASHAPGYALGRGQLRDHPFPLLLPLQVRLALGRRSAGRGENGHPVARRPDGDPRTRRTQAGLRLRTLRAAAAHRGRRTAGESTRLLHGEPAAERGDRRRRHDAAAAARRDVADVTRGAGRNGEIVHPRDDHGRGTRLSLLLCGVPPARRSRRRGRSGQLCR